MVCWLWEYFCQTADENLTEVLGHSSPKSHRNGLRVMKTLNKRRYSDKIFCPTYSTVVMLAKPKFGCAISCTAIWYQLLKHECSILLQPILPICKKNQKRIETVPLDIFCNIRISLVYCEIPACQYGTWRQNDPFQITVSTN